ncbi:MAG: hypothetical protein ABSC51_10200 [Gaiellaceae bacterium]|jgi:hypothetical protein
MALPTKDELEFASFSLGHFGSDLDGFVSDVRAYADKADVQPSDHDAAAHVLAFAVDARDSIASALKDLEKLAVQALHVLHEAVDGEDYWQRVATALIEEGTRIQQ